MKVIVLSTKDIKVNFALHILGFSDTWSISWSVLWVWLYARSVYIR